MATTTYKACPASVKGLTEGLTCQACKHAFQMKSQAMLPLQMGSKSRHKRSFKVLLAAQHIAVTVLEWPKGRKTAFNTDRS